MRSKATGRLISYYADLHIHSALSPCAENKMTPEEVVKKIKSFGIEIFSITDHNSVFNYSAFLQTAKEHDVLLIPGIELQTAEEIHLLGYFPSGDKLNEFYSNVVKPGIMSGMKNDPKRFGNQIKIDGSGEIMGEEEAMLSMPLIHSIDKLVDSIHGFGGVAVAAHIDRGFSLISHLGYIPPDLAIDAVEIWNLAKMEELQTKYLKGRQMNIISSTDSHHLHMMKPPKMKFWMNRRKISSCLDCIKGEGTGRISISQKRIGKKSGSRDSSENASARRSNRDWKTIYG